MSKLSRIDRRNAGLGRPAGLGSGWNEAVEINGCDCAEALAEGREIVAEPNHVPGIVANCARRVMAHSEVDDEIADLRDDGITLIGGPSDFAAGQNDALEMHDRIPTCRGQAEANPVHNERQTP
ncbi:hypothetical protein [Microvirga zambiensis]|uniref:hypothetical protein n=1 Tax=Microvirga zambiensis TaxID=1402137 RepID=UPI00191C96DA|nr:hypothetical protein [Microvirga zambiensis]